MMKAIDFMARKKAAKKKNPPSKPGDAEAVIREMASALREHADFLEGCIVVYERIGRPPLNVLTGKFYMRLKMIRETFNIQLLAKMQKAKKGVFESHHAIFGDLINRLGDLADKMTAMQQRKTENGK